MPKTKPARAPQIAKPARRFSLVSAEAQQQMYRALSRLKPSKNGGASGSEVAEIAVCLAAGEPSALILTCPARGARTVGKASRVVAAKEGRLTAATLAAMDALLRRSLAEDAPTEDALAEDARGKDQRGKKSQIKSQIKDALRAHPVEAAAIVCAGHLDSEPEAQRDYRAAFRFAARHKLPILYLVANRLTPGQRPALDLRTLYPEFGIPLFTVDAADAIAAYRVATEALHNARHLRGPCVIEALAVAPPATGAASPLQLLAAYMERHDNPPR